MVSWQVLVNKNENTSQYKIKKFNQPNHHNLSLHNKYAMQTHATVYIQFTFKSNEITNSTKLVFCQKN